MQWQLHSRQTPSACFRGPGAATGALSSFVLFINVIHNLKQPKKGNLYMPRGPHGYIKYMVCLYKASVVRARKYQLQVLP